MGQAQQGNGIIAGNIIADATAKKVSGATLQAINLSDTSIKTLSLVSDDDGAFSFSNLGAGYYRLTITAVGFGPVTIDSIYLRNDRMDFNLDDIRLKTAGQDLNTVVVYAEKPLVEEKDGKIIFNTGESALAGASSTTELLKQTPLVSVDEDGKVLMKGKEVKILIDDKPVEMDARQLQDLLESMPGSMIEKIEVLTTPPPQYANERGGVINIVTKKGRVGRSGRINFNYGTRGQAGASASFSYRKNGFAINSSAGYAYNRYNSSSQSFRTNLYADSSNYFNTTGQNENSNARPNARVNIDYERNKQNNFSFTAIFNSGKNESASVTGYSNINQYDTLYKRSNRQVASGSDHVNASVNFSYSHKWKTEGEILRIIASSSYGLNDALRNFYQQYLVPGNLQPFADSTQQQLTRITNHTQSLRINYDKPLPGNKCQLNLGGNLLYNRSHNNLYSSYLRRPENEMVENALLSNDFAFYQTLYSLRAAIRYAFIPNLYSNIGLQQEFASTYFDLLNNSNNYRNHYSSPLPFWNITRKWDNGHTLSVSYKRSIQRPGLRQLNPSIDYADPYNTRFGNPYLLPYYADNIDLTAGYWHKKYNYSLSLGFNTLQNIYSSIRTLQADGKTNTTWKNLGGRKEYEIAGWGGLSTIKNLRLHGGASYVYHVYSSHDKAANRYRNAGTFNSSLNANYQWTPLRNLSANFTYNRFATPQGSARSNLSMNIGVQQKFFKKAMSLSLNIVDPFRQQSNHYFIEAPGYFLESFNNTRSRNLRIALAYLFKKKEMKKAPAKKL